MFRLHLDYIWLVKPLHDLIQIPSLRFVHRRDDHQCIKHPLMCIFLFPRFLFHSDKIRHSSNWSESRRSAC